MVARLRLDVVLALGVVVVLLLVAVIISLVAHPAQALTLPGLHQLACGSSIGPCQ